MLRLKMKRPSLIAIVGLVVGLAISSLFPGAALARPVQPHFNRFLSTHAGQDDAYSDNNPDSPSNGGNGASQEAYDNAAYPGTYIGYNQAVGASTAYQSTVAHTSLMSAAWRNSQATWQLVGPTLNTVAPQATYTGRVTANSGRVTAIAVSNKCTTAFCRVWVGAAGGGIWTTTNGLAAAPTWHSSSDGLASNAIGSITIDPTDASGKTLYVGTGEPNGSSDSEAGVGLYKSTDYGESWHLVPGSVPAAKDRSIASVAIDPKNARHIYIGTAVARHGSSSVNGGRFSPPDAPVIGLYESRDGGATFKLVFSKESDVVDPNSPNGADFYRGGITKILFDRTSLASRMPSAVYFSVFDYGLYRSNSGSFEQVFASAGGGTVANSSSSRTEFALAPNKGKLRIYVDDSGSGPADFYRVDNALVPASTLTNGTTNPGWIKLSNATPGTPGFSSYANCGAQCYYDMFVASPPGHPDTVWLGGSMVYSEIFTANPPSNGRAVMRSTNAGVSFTDMTDDAQNPPIGMHPDQHAIAFAPGNPDIAVIGSDGGVIRTSGSFANTSSDCNNRGLTSPADLTDCKLWLSAIPTRLYSLNVGLATIQFQSVTFNPQNPNHDIIGGTQDNGTWSYQGTQASWFESVGGDGGQSVIDAGNPNIRMHTYFGPNMDVNFNGTDPNGWDLIADPLMASKESASFYVPLIGDPLISQTMFVGLQHVWRTQDSGGKPAYLQQYCNEITGAYNPTVTPCGDWVPVGPDLSGSAFGTDKGGSAPLTNYVVALTRAAGNNNVLWSATRRGRLFISTNANAAPASVKFTRIDTAAQPTRFISGIAVDPKNPYHAYVSFSGYNAYTPATPGHVFDVTYNPTTGKATWKDISHNLGDQPITGIAYDGQKGNIYVSTDFGVLKLEGRSTWWVPAANGLPRVAVYGLSLSNAGRVLYAATHGRGAWKLKLNS
ncbi:MAG: hypothetical protein JO011_07445 [Ktedonobacteraceae bacterium]|nr:hypothetical protein [Ktedonobacteraceae bacterium]